MAWHALKGRVFLEDGTGRSETWKWHFFGISRPPHDMILAETGMAGFFGGVLDGRPEAGRGEKKMGISQGESQMASAPVVYCTLGLSENVGYIFPMK